MHVEPPHEQIQPRGVLLGLNAPTTSERCAQPVAYVSMLRVYLSSGD